MQGLIEKNPNSQHILKQLIFDSHNDLSHTSLIDDPKQVSPAKTGLTSLMPLPELDDMEEDDFNLPDIEALDFTLKSISCI